LLVVDLSGLVVDNEVAPIEVLDVDSRAAERLDKGDGALDPQVSALPLKVVVLVLLQHQDNVTRQHARLLSNVQFLMEK
jgi:hypothetical protein